MAKAIATIADVNTFDTLNPGNFTLTVPTVVIVSATNYSKKELQIVLTGSENPQQMNTAMVNAITSYATTAHGVTLAPTDVSVPKFS